MCLFRFISPKRRGEQGKVHELHDQGDLPWATPEPTLCGYV